jgi:alpha-tubulin suppressor-like RCC1 family protein
MRTVTRSPLAALLAIALFGCADDSDPVSPDQRTVRPRYYEGEMGEILTKASSPDIALLGIQVSGPELKDPLRYQIPLADGLSTMPLALPTGHSYELEVRGYDRYGEQTFAGTSSLEYVELGENRRLSVALDPLGKAERAEATFTVMGEELAPEGMRLEIVADRRSAGEGQSVLLRAYGIDARSNRMPLDPARLHWSVDDPRLGRLDIDPLAPTGSSDALILKFLDQLERPRPELGVMVTYGQVWVGILIGILANGFVDVSAGHEVTCGVRQFGDLSCWGSNIDLMLGLGGVRPADRCKPDPSSTIDCSARPVSITGGRFFSRVSVGSRHVCALEIGTGAAFCWGRNGAGQLGVPTSTTFSTTPVAVDPPAGGSTLAFTSISAGGGMTCAVTAAGAEFCWGAGFGAAPVQQPRAVSTTTAANGFSCRMDGIGVWCDGAPFPASQTGGFSVLGQATTANHVCAIDTATQTWCWGNNSHGQLGNGSMFGSKKQVNAPSALNAIATGMNHSCALSGNVAFCWGNNFSGELGIGTQAGMTNAPTRVTNGPTTPTWTKISTGARHTCAIDNNGAIWCWGNNYLGQLGNGGKIDFIMGISRQGVFEPVRVVS